MRVTCEGRWYEWLLYAPRNLSEGLTEADGKVSMSRKLALTLLDTLLIAGYAHAFARAPEYGYYCHKKLSEYSAQIGNSLALEENPRVISAD